MPKVVLLRAAIHIIDEIEPSEYFAIRTLEGDINSMAHLFAHALKDQPPVRLCGSNFYLRLGCVPKGALPMATSTFQSGKEWQTYQVRFRAGRKHPDISVFDPKGKELYSGSIYAFCIEYNELSIAKVKVTMAERAARTERQRKRRKERKELDDYGKAHARTPEHLRKKLKYVSIEEATRLAKGNR